MEIVNIERENEGKFTAGDKPSEDNIKINRHTSENILKPVDEVRINLILFVVRGFREIHFHLDINFFKNNILFLRNYKSKQH